MGRGAEFDGAAPLQSESDSEDRQAQRESAVYLLPRLSNLQGHVSATLLNNAARGLGDWSQRLQGSLAFHSISRPQCTQVRNSLP